MFEYFFIACLGCEKILPVCYESVIYCPCGKKFGVFKSKEDAEAQDDDEEEEGDDG